jgi:hypothetical protein
MKVPMCEIQAETTSSSISIKIVFTISTTVTLFILSIIYFLILDYMKIGGRWKIFYELLENFVKRSMIYIPFSTAENEKIVFVLPAELNVFKARLENRTGPNTL